MKRFRRLCFFCAILFFLSLVFSVTFLTAQADHKHFNEETCAICVEIQTCGELLHAPAAGAVRLAAEEFFSFGRFLPLSGERQKRSSSRPTLVSLKVKLSS